MMPGIPKAVDAKARSVRLSVWVFVIVSLVLAAPQTAVARSKESITIGWKSPVNQPICLSMSSGGKYFASVDKDGTVRLYDQKGHLLWKQKVDGATNVLVARNAESVLVYSRLNPEYQEVRFYRRDGRLLWRHSVEGSVWDGAISTDGRRAAVTTGERYVYVYTPDDKRPTYRRWRMDGIGHCITFTPSNKRIVIGTWQESSLVCYSTEGDFQWRSRHEDDRRYELCMSPDGRRVLGIIPGSQHDTGVEVCLWDAGGKRLWKRVLDGFDGRALVSPKSEYVAVSYADYLSDENRGMIERKVAVYRSNGELVWEKGGLFFGPQLVALSPTGSSVIVTDGEKSLYNMDSRGRILSKLTLGATVRKTVSSENGSLILLYCGDGWLYMMRVG